MAIFPKYLKYSIDIKDNYIYLEEFILVFSLIIIIFLVFLNIKSFKLKEEKNKPFYNLIYLFLFIMLLISYYYNYFKGIISGDTLVGLMIITVVIIVQLMIYTHTKYESYWRNSILILIILLFAIFIFLDAKLPVYDKYINRYTLYSETIEAGESTNIYIISVGNETHTKNTLINQNNIFFNKTEVNNSWRYSLCSSCAINKINNLLIGSDLADSLKNAELYLGKETLGIKIIKARENDSGNSAGLALVIGGLVEIGELVNEIPIAITGAIDNDGNVIAIGGVEEKVQIAAIDQHEMIIVPEENYFSAIKKVEELNLPLEVYSVSTIDQAIEFIEMKNQ